MKWKILFSLALTALFLFLPSALLFAWMDSSYNRPRPLMDYVSQDVGIYDTGYQNLWNTDCQACHQDHHQNGGACLSLSGPCHRWEDRFNNGWHHNSDASAAKNCVACHDDTLIGPYNPPKSFSETPPVAAMLPTPFSCENCHWAQPVTVEGHPTGYDLEISHNMMTHHMDAGGGNVANDCDMCHIMDVWYPVRNDPESIRYCESCHTKDTLHAIHRQDFLAWEAVGFHAVGKPDADPDTDRIFTVEEMCSGCHAPVIRRFKRAPFEPGKAFVIVGENFGVAQGDSVVSIGPTIFDASNPRIKLWSDTKIKIRMPFKNKPCEWYKHGEGTYRKRKVWVTVSAVDSNTKILKLLKPDACQ